MPVSKDAPAFRRGEHVTVSMDGPGAAAAAVSESLWSVDDVDGASRFVSSPKKAPAPP
jgi:hypothetical protein